MKKSTRIWLLIGILIIATFLRFYHFTSTPPGLYPDEAADGNNAVQVAETNHFAPFYTEDNGREGLYVNVIAVFLKVWPVYEPWVIRLPAAVSGVLTVLALYLLGAELFGAEVGLLAAFLLATSFWHINFSRIGFRAIMAPLLLTWTLYVLIKAFKTPYAKIGYWLAAIAGIVYGLGFYTYIAYRVTPLLFLLFIPFFKKHPDFWKRAGVFILLTFIVALPIGWYFLQNPSAFFGRTSEIAVTNGPNPIATFGENFVKTVLMFNIHGDDNWRHNISGAPELYWPVGIIFIIGFIVGLFILLRITHKRTWHIAHRNYLPAFALLLVFAWFVLAMLPAIASNDGIPHALRSILMLPPVMLFAALGGVEWYKLLRRSHAGFALFLGILFIVAVGYTGYADYFIVWAQNPNVPGAFNQDYVDVAHAMNALPLSTPKYVIINAGGVTDHGIPVPADTVMFLTHSYTNADRAAENITYLLPGQQNQIPNGAPSWEVFEIN